MNKVNYLFVTCCREESRFAVLEEVVSNLIQYEDLYKNSITVFDNSSIIDNVQELLKDNFDNVILSDTNVGYWSAINYWLNIQDKSDYTYIIESDMMHYDMNSLTSCIDYLDKNTDNGSVRTHEYSIENWHLYDKNQPRSDSRRALWQSHTNKVTNKKINHTLKFDNEINQIYETNFLTQLPALNRSDTMKRTFDILSKLENFSEFDFQKLYWKEYQKTGIIDKGLFNCDQTKLGSGAITGSWSNPNALKEIGYLPTRQATIKNSSKFKLK